MSGGRAQLTCFIPVHHPTLPTDLSLIMTDNEKRVAAQAMARYQATPIHSLPPEIMREIFILATDTRHFCFKRLPIPHNPILAVCHDWRHIALNTAALWSRFHLRRGVYPLREPGDLGYHQSHRSCAYLWCEEAFEFWLSHSGNDLIDIYHFDQYFDTTIWPRLVDQAHRWRT